MDLTWLTRRQWLGIKTAVSEVIPSGKVAEERDEVSKWNHPAGAGLTKLCVSQQTGLGRKLEESRHNSVRSSRNTAINAQWDGLTKRHSKKSSWKPKQPEARRTVTFQIYPRFNGSGWLALNRNFSVGNWDGEKAVQRLYGSWPKRRNRLQRWAQYLYMNAW